MSHRPTQKEKTQRAFEAYLDLLDAAEWFKSEVRVPLAAFDLTINEFRVLELLYREGAQFATELAKKQRKTRPWIDELVGRLEKRGWMARKVVALPPVEFERMHWPASMRDEPREGRRVTVVGLTKSGKKFFRNVLPRHSKLVKAFMRTLNGTEQESLARLCRKLREGDVVKFAREIRMEEPED